MSDEETIEEAIKHMGGDMVMEASVECGGLHDSVTVIRIETETVQFVLDDGDVRLRY